MNILLIEDETDFVEDVRRAVEHSPTPHHLFTVGDVGLLDGFKEGSSFEEQFLERLRAIRQRHGIDVVLLDTDLSRFQANAISQTVCRQALQELGLPACRYKKTYTQTQSNRLRDLKRVAREGSSAVWVPPDLVKGHDMTPLVHWLEAVDQGFKLVQQRLDADPDLLKKHIGPAGILAKVLVKPSLRADLLGYTTQNLFFFGAPVGEDNDLDSVPSSQVLATRLGYWLVNYILTFPGPILNTAAAAAYLNVSVEALEHPALRAFVAPALYAGPFDGLGPFYWRAQLAALIDATGDVCTLPQFEGVALPRVDAATPGAPAYYCVLTGQPVASADTANPNPDWIPPGAEVTRIRQELLDDLDPMMST